MAQIESAVIGVSGNVTTSNAANTIAWRHTTISGRAYKLFVHVIANNADAPAKVYSATLSATFLSDSGSISQIGLTDIVATDASLLMTATSSIQSNGDRIGVVVNGEIGQNYIWTVSGTCLRA